MKQEIEEMGTQTEVMAERIRTAIVEAYEVLIRERDAQIEAGFTPRNEEREILTAEHRSTGEAMHNLAAILPARARQAQRIADDLLLAGKTEEAAAKHKEQEDAERAPESMKERLRDIEARFTAIEEEKKNIARRAFTNWLAKLQSLIRVVEHGLFIELLDSSRAAMYSYQEQHGLGGTLDNPYGFLVKDFHIENLTAPAQSVEYNSGSRWYGGRGRR
jgi:hypothetical protein